MVLCASYVIDSIGVSGVLLALRFREMKNPSLRDGCVVLISLLSFSLASLGVILCGEKLPGFVDVPPKQLVWATCQTILFLPVA